MDNAWTLRIMLFAALALVIFGDFFGYGSIKGVKSASNQGSAGKFQQKQTEFELTDDEESDLQDLTPAEFKKQRVLAKSQLTDAIRDSCLPKMLCEMASKPEYVLSEKEKDLLHMIRSSTMSLAMNSPPSKWHFAAHMGELLKHTADNLSGPMGCANLWPHCPISSKKLMKLSYKVNLK
ncbi:uncharacterized protein LOC129919891 [Episyrphus balteatus]|uniref:uncharacterized protein LOC129919891 n=1 Tax=Episyrphus balteatus TaxID=286459 RepID=UPI0024867062|nr:uncharacterized protein LOC129919891 [Episyrphus balteatus]